MGRTKSPAFLNNPIHLKSSYAWRDQAYRSKRRGFFILGKSVKFFVFFSFTFSLATQFMEVSEIKPGMRGVGKTVFSQMRIEEFEVEIIDVMKNTSPRGDIILARLSGGSIPGGLEKTGVIAGMSGSPVYINGKMIGAVAYTWSFQKEPIAGITPIRGMLEIINMDKHGMTPAPNQDFQWTKRQSNLSHIPIPIAFSSSALTEYPEFMNQIKSVLSDYGMLPVLTAGVSANDKPVELEPGAAVGVSLIQGDMTVSGIGTLTYRDKEKILAFGHPMMLGGKTEMPMVGGIIHTVMPSQALSFKLFSPTNPIGIVTQDRANGIMGKIGETTKLIPIKVMIQSTGFDPNRIIVDTTFNYESIDHRILFPSLLQMIALNSISATERIFGEATISADVSLQVEMSADKSNRSVSATSGVEQIKFRRRVSSDAAALAIVSSLTEPVRILLENDFEGIKLTNIDIKLKIENGRKFARIEKLIVNQEKVKPGDSIDITIVLRAFQGNVFDRTLRILIPKETPAGNLMLVAANADSTYYLEFNQAPESFSPKNFRQLVEQIEGLGKANELVISGYISQRGLVVGGQELPNPPQFLKQVMARRRNSPRADFTESSLFIRQSLTTEEIIVGIATLNLIVER